MNDTDADPRTLTVPELLARLSRETTFLVRQEIALAKAELAEKGRHAGLGAGLFGGASVFGLGAFGALTACFIAGLATGMPAWFAALIVAVVYGVIAAFMAWRARSEVKRAGSPVPQTTLQTLKEDIEWAKTRPPSVKA